MRIRSVAVATTIAVLLAAGAVGAFLRAKSFRSEAQWLLARSAAEAESYANSFDSESVDKQLGSFDVRREALERAEIWQRTEMLLIMASVVAGFCSYVLYLLSRLRDQLIESAAAVEQSGTLPPALAVPPGRSRS